MYYSNKTIIIILQNGTSILYTITHAYSKHNRLRLSKSCRKGAKDWQEKSKFDIIKISKLKTAAVVEGESRMQYVERVLEDLKKKNPNEPEFHQAATEILNGLKPVIEKHPE